VVQQNAQCQITAQAVDRMKSVGGDFPLYHGLEEAEADQTGCNRERYGDDEGSARCQRKAAYLHGVV
jgi:hypothetical protein